MTRAGVKTGLVAVGLSALAAGCATTIDTSGPLGRYRYDYDSRIVYQEPSVVYRTEPTVVYRTEPRVVYRTEPKVVYRTERSLVYGPTVSYYTP
jgi:hypothetical protein